MALAEADFKQPTGRLQAAWFTDVDASLTAWLAEAVTVTASITDATLAEGAQKSWVYYRAYQSLYESALVSPAETRTQETWDRWTEGQIRELGRLASNYQQDYFRAYNRGILGQDFIPVVPGYVRRRATTGNESPYPL